LTSNRTRPKDRVDDITHGSEFVVRPAASILGAAAAHISLKAPMHFGVYLMIAALVLMGVEVGYALYQLASFVL
jgi:hypothetical protein